jgi:GH25 family lysozyme M1 (1,4-beta-N-acetylmuramidase)
MTAQVPMIDVSANNHPTDEPIQWARVRAAGYGAVMVKATEGADYVNPWLARDANAASQAGLEVGYYHFAHPAATDSATQAEHALAAIDGLPRSLGLALDLEVGEGISWNGLAVWAQEFHRVALQTVDHSPLYVNDYYLANLPGAPWGVRLWLAQTARPRRQVWAWQATQPIQVNGIVTPTDVGFLHPDA